MVSSTFRCSVIVTVYNPNAKCFRNTCVYPYYVLNGPNKTTSTCRLEIPQTFYSTAGKPFSICYVSLLLLLIFKISHLRLMCADKISFRERQNLNLKENVLVAKDVCRKRNSHLRTVRFTLKL